MKPIIQMKNFSKKNGTTNVCDQLNLSINKGSFLTILAQNGSGKTTLANCLMDASQNSKHIIFSKSNLKIEILTQNNSYQCDHVISEWKYYSKKNKKSKIMQDLITYFGVESLLEHCISHLSENQKKIVFFIRSCLIQPDVIVLDDFVSNMDLKNKKLIFCYLNEINQNNKTTIINITSQSEDSLFGKEIAIFNKGKIIIHDQKEIVLKDEKNFKNSNLMYPFLADLSLKLKYYNLLDQLILDKEKMVDLLWK